MFRIRIRGLAPVAVAAFCVLLACAAGCGRRAETPAEGPRLAIIAVDALDSEWMEPLIEAGRLPHLAQLIAEGVCGPVRGPDPQRRPDALWSVAAAGHPAAKAPGYRRMGGRAVKVPGMTPFWETAAAAGLRTVVVGWPGELRDLPGGVMVGEYLPYSPRRDHLPTPAVRPDSLAEELSALHVGKSDFPPDELARFIDPEAAAKVPESIITSERNMLAAIYADDLTTLDTARRLAARRECDLFTVRYRGLGEISRNFWRYTGRPGPWSVTPEQRAALGQVVERYYEFVDDLIGETLAGLPAGTPAVVVSAFGWRGPVPAGDVWDAGPGAQRPEGWLVMRTPRHEAGAAIERMRLEDLAPTLLALAGVAPDPAMAGVVRTGGADRAGRRFLEDFAGEAP